MALHHFASVSICSFSFATKIGPDTSITARSKSTTLITTTCPVRCTADAKPTPQNNAIVRRSANYQPPIWSFDYVQSIKTKYVGEAYARQANKLKEEVRLMLEEEVEDSLAQIELIDILQRLGLSYHFKNEIKIILKQIYSKSKDTWKKNNLYTTALKFRLLRQYGFPVPQEVFEAFKDETGSFKACMSDDVKGMLSLYEASFYMTKGENILEEARDFTTKGLIEYLKRTKDHDDEDLSMLVRHALELPLHWRMERLETRWFIDVYQSRPENIINSTLLEFAKLDFNLVQSTHQDDLKHVSRWWRHSELGEKLSFARDSLMECFLWSVGAAFEPELKYFRKMSTIVYVLLTVIDDIYDVYGTVEELELFTNAVERWDVNAINELPDYMKICFYALYNSVNEMAFDVLKQHDLLIIKYLQKVWADICRSYLLEAKWFHNGYTPTLEEYFENGWISVSCPVIFVHSYFFLLTNINININKEAITEGALESLVNYSSFSIIRHSSMMVRLSDDLGTSSDELRRGDVAKSIQCYMHEAGVCEDEARRHIKLLINEMWKQMNEDELLAESHLSEIYSKVVINFARTSLCMYQHGDGFAGRGHEINERILSLLVNPIPFEI